MIVWQVVDMTRHASSGVVDTVYWLVESYQGEIGARRGGNTLLPPVDPNSPSFIPYEDLTEAICIDWVKDCLGTDEVLSIESNLEEQIQEQISPTILNGKPW